MILENFEQTSHTRNNYRYFCSFVWCALLCLSPRYLDPIWKSSMYDSQLLALLPALQWNSHSRTLHQYNIIIDCNRLLNHSIGNFPEHRYNYRNDSHRIGVVSRGILGRNNLHLRWLNCASETQIARQLDKFLL